PLRLRQGRVSAQPSRWRFQGLGGTGTGRGVGAHWPKKTRTDWPWMAGHCDRNVGIRTPLEGTMRHVMLEPGRPLDTDGMPGIATGPGKWFGPLRFAADGWSELMRLEPGAGVPLHRHTGEVHAFNLAGSREIVGTGERAGPGGYVYEPAGLIDGWAAVGDEP